MATALAAGYAAASTDTGHTGPSSNTFANEDVLDRLRASRDSRDDGRRQSDGERLLRRRAEALVLQRLLDRRTPGADRGAALSRRLRRHRRRRAGDVTRRSRRSDRSGFARRSADPASALPREKLDDAARRACSRRATGSTARRTACSRIRWRARSIRRCSPARTGAEPASCLTQPQVDAVQKIYAGASNPRTGRHIFAGPRARQRAGLVRSAGRLRRRLLQVPSCSRIRAGIRRR